ncbi:MAG: preprotein translocase subunit SecE [Candidatus Dormibacteraceae bacterium]
MAVTADKRAEQRPSSEFAPARFLREVYEELRKVVWPTGPELYRYTLVVIFTVLLLGTFIGGTDYLLSAFAKRVIYNGTH